MSEEAKDFIQALLNKNLSKRPTANMALQHSWLNFERKSSKMRGKK